MSDRGVSSIEFASVRIFAEHLAVTNLSRVTFPHLIRRMLTASVTSLLSLNLIATPQFTIAEGGKLTSVDMHGESVAVIPDGVTCIWDGAFQNCYTLTSLTIPASVTRIVGVAFEGCGNLVSITFAGDQPSTASENFRDVNPDCIIRVPNDRVYNVNDRWYGLKVERFDSSHEPGIGSSVRWLINNGELIGVELNGATEVTIPNSVTIIGKDVFQGCDDLASVVIGDSVIRIGEGAFRRCHKLKNVVVGNAVTEICMNAFEDCHELTKVTLGQGLERIGHSAFAYCDKLADLVLPDALTTIEAYAFQGCRSMSKLTVPSAVTSIGEFAFSGVEFVDVADNNSAFKSVNGLILTKDGTKLIFCNQGQISVTIPDGVKSIEQYSFSRCGSLKNVTVPDSTTSIGRQAFEDCQALECVMLGCGMSNVDESSFVNCGSLVSFTVNSSNVNYKSVSGLLLSRDGMTVVQGVNGAVEIPLGVKRVAKDAFYGRSGLASVIMPSSLMSIEGYAFCGCDNLKSVIIPDAVTCIDDFVFSYCRSLESVTILGNVTNIGEFAFSEAAFSSFAMPEGVASVEAGSFYGCDKLVSVTLPSSVTRIDVDAFPYCTNLRTVYVDNGCTDQVKGLYEWPEDVEFVEIVKPVVEGDSSAIVVGDPVNGYLVRPSKDKQTVDVVIPQGVDAAKVTVRLLPNVNSVKPHGATVKIVSENFDITSFLDVPQPDVNGVIDLTKATVKDEFVDEALDVKRGAVIKLNAENPTLMTPNTRRGLIYQLREGTTLGGMVDGDSTFGDGNPWIPTITVKGGTSAFYTISVSK